MTEEQQDLLITKIADKLEQLTVSHNALVMASRGMLAQINALMLRVQALEQTVEEKKDA